MSDEAMYSIRPWGDGYWRWQCLKPLRYGACSGIVGPPMSRDDAEAAAAQHRADVHEGLLEAFGREGTPRQTRRTSARQPDDDAVRHAGVAYGLAWFAERASQQRRSRS